MSLIFLFTLSILSTIWLDLTVLAVLITLVVLIWYKTRINRISYQKRELEVLVRRRTSEIELQKQEIENQKNLLEIEKEKVDKLLSNILPKEAIEELKNKGKTTARHFRLASVMFTDFKGFTKISEKLRPHELVEALDACFIQFDNIISKYNVEQIKTIGDSYMCAGGLPIRNRSNPIDIVLAGLEIQRYMKELNKLQASRNEDLWEVRVGIHTGELIAGVLGTKRFAYDIWGDTVNIASALEHFGEVGRVNISGNTYHLIKSFFDCTYRGKAKSKSPEEVDMYFVDKIKVELSENGEGIIPNAIFRQNLQSNLDRNFNYKKAEQHIVKLLRIKLPEGLYYHGLHHTLDVCNAAERIAQSEGIEGEDLFLLLTAALIHDAGFTMHYSEHEEASVELARQILPQYGYSDKQLGVIERIIMATKLPLHPMTRLEQIMCDADLDYLGRDDFHRISEDLKHEMEEHGMVKNDKHWDEIQIHFFEVHQYYTATSIALREEKKQQHFAEIKARYEQYA